MKLKFILNIVLFAGCIFLLNMAYAEVSKLDDSFDDYNFPAEHDVLLETDETEIDRYSNKLIASVYE